LLPIGVLNLQGDVAEHLNIFKQIGVPALPVKRANEIADISALILPGGESTTLWKLLRIFNLMDPLRERIKEGLPVYGTCAGMILLANYVLDGIDGQESIGGLGITVRRNAFGRQVDSFEMDLKVGSIERFPAVFIRAPWIENVESTVEVLASVRREEREYPVAVKQGKLLATSFHPEVTADARIHQYFVEAVVGA